MSKSRLTPEQLDAFKTTHKRIAHVQSEEETSAGLPEWEVVLRPPTQAEYKQAKAYGVDDRRKATVNEWMFRKMCVFPQGEELESLLDTWPGLYDGCIEAMNKLTGASGKERGK